MSCIVLGGTYSYDKKYSNFENSRVFLDCFEMIATMRFLGSTLVIIDANVS